MVQITETNDVVTLINVFTVRPEDQEKLVDLLLEATQKTMSDMPGFVSANIHKSSDGTRVANYAQWRSNEDFQAMLHNPEALEHMKAVGQIATNDAHVYKVVESISMEALVSHQLEAR